MSASTQTAPGHRPDRYNQLLNDLEVILPLPGGRFTFRQRSAVRQVLKKYSSVGSKGKPSKSRDSVNNYGQESDSVFGPPKAVNQAFCFPADIEEFREAYGNGGPEGAGSPSPEEFLSQARARSLAPSPPPKLSKSAPSSPPTKYHLPVSSLLRSATAPPTTAGDASPSGPVFVTAPSRSDSPSPNDSEFSVKTSVEKDEPAPAKSDFPTKPSVEKDNEETQITVVPNNVFSQEDRESTQDTNATYARESSPDTQEQQEQMFTAINYPFLQNSIASPAASSGFSTIVAGSPRSRSVSHAANSIGGASAFPGSHAIGLASPQARTASPPARSTGRASPFADTQATSFTPRRVRTASPPASPHSTSGYKVMTPSFSSVSKKRGGDASDDADDSDDSDDDVKSIGHAGSSPKRVKTE
ncbi:hypothetical protein K469DRAFT_746742 [Zopfia rhizophila CBS 207.26]|uniref:Uncharacterized protein n=1 Tax=Zopfia rhizophila CBS 207.26 TaxID=1314779 RepID=A0A6A6EJ47_9PEZI|nr:hypothetical protein K469DRAFT_746742 [Zopfia rhizophila CBS 207.26]